MNKKGKIFILQTLGILAVSIGLYFWILYKFSEFAFPHTTAKAPEEIWEATNASWAVIMSLALAGTTTGMRLSLILKRQTAKGNLRKSINHLTLLSIACLILSIFALGSAKNTEAVLKSIDFGAQVEILQVLDQDIVTNDDVYLKITEGSNIQESHTIEIKRDRAIDIVKNSQSAAKLDTPTPKTETSPLENASKQ